MKRTPSQLPLEVQGSTAQPLGMSAELFLRYYWQQAPLLIRQAFADFRSPLSGDDLAALATHDDALARLVRYRRKADRWELRHGPLSEADFDQLPEQDWTLLVQDVDKWDAEVAQLLTHFRFLPSWRIDDIMVSFAAPGGSVGAHVDHYDVFLLQGSGHRRWAIDSGANPDLSYRDDAPLKLLRRFEPTHSWLLAPGDMLYLPPGVPHHGIAEDACLTLSIGMRAPATAELLLPLMEEHAEQLGEEQRFRDPGRTPCADPEALEDSDVERFRAQIVAALTELQQCPTDQLADFCGRFLSQYRQASLPRPRRRPSVNAIDKALQQGQRLYVPNAFRRLSRSGSHTTLYLCGQRCVLTKAAAAALLNGGLGSGEWATLSADIREQLRELLSEGIIVMRKARRQ